MLYKSLKTKNSRSISRFTTNDSQNIGIQRFYNNNIYKIYLMNTK